MFVGRFFCSSWCHLTFIFIHSIQWQLSQSIVEALERHGQSIDGYLHVIIVFSSGSYDLFPGKPRGYEFSLVRYRFIFACTNRDKEKMKFRPYKFTSHTRADSSTCWCYCVRCRTRQTEIDTQTYRERNTFLFFNGKYFFSS